MVRKINAYFDKVKKEKIYIELLYQNKYSNIRLSKDMLKFIDKVVKIDEVISYDEFRYHLNRDEILFNFKGLSKYATMFNLIAMDRGFLELFGCEQKILKIDENIYYKKKNYFEIEFNTITYIQKQLLEIYERNNIWSMSLFWNPGDDSDTIINNIIEIFYPFVCIDLDDYLFVNRYKIYFHERYGKCVDEVFNKIYARSNKSCYYYIDKYLYTAAKSILNGHDIKETIEKYRQIVSSFFYIDIKNNYYTKYEYIEKRVFSIIENSFYSIDQISKREKLLVSEILLSNIFLEEEMYNIENVFCPNDYKLMRFFLKYIFCAESYNEEKRYLRGTFFKNILKGKVC